MSNAAANNAVELYLLTQTDIDLGNIKTEFTHQQREHALTLMVEKRATLVDGMSQMRPAG